MSAKKDHVRKSYVSIRYSILLLLFNTFNFYRKYKRQSNDKDLWISFFDPNIFNYYCKELHFRSISTTSINLSAASKRLNRNHNRINNFQSAFERRIDFYIVLLSAAYSICGNHRSTRRTIKVGHGFIQWRFEK